MPFLSADGFSIHTFCFGPYLISMARYRLPPLNLNFVAKTKPTFICATKSLHHHYWLWIKTGYCVDSAWFYSVNVIVIFLMRHFKASSYVVITKCCFTRKFKSFAMKYDQVNRKQFLLQWLLLMREWVIEWKGVIALLKAVLTGIGIDCYLEKSPLN